MEILITLLTIAAIIAIVKIVAVRHTSHAAGDHIPFAFKFFARDRIISEAEAQFFTNLTGAIEGKYLIFPKQHLNSFIGHKVKGQSWKGAFSKIDQKFVDYLLVDKDSFKPIAAIELDDWTHERADGAERDNTLGLLLASVDIPLIRFSNEEIDKDKIATKLNHHKVGQHAKFRDTSSDISEVIAIK